MPSDRLDRLAATPSIIAHLVVEADDARLDDAPAAGWSMRIVLAHLRDQEYLVLRLALERLLAEDGPTLAALHDGEWLARRSQSRDRKELLLADFALQRQASLSILRGIRPQDWERGGYAADGTPLTIATLIERWLVEDARHIAMLEELAGETYAEAVERRRRREE